jgi:hypothetical protein
MGTAFWMAGPATSDVTLTASLTAGVTASTPDWM